MSTSVYELLREVITSLSRYVRTDTAQEFSEDEKEVARENIGAGAKIESVTLETGDETSTLTFTFSDGTKQEVQFTTPGGTPGADGTSITISSVTESEDDGGSNVVTFSDGTTLTVKNGSKGSDGAAGKDGADGSPGADGKDGADGYTPVKGVDYSDGADGKDGADGYTPVKGVDYYTEEDKAELVSAVLANFVNVAEVGA